MSGNLRLYGATSGYSQISAPDVAGDQIFVVPSLGGEVIVSGNNQSLDLGTGDLSAADGTFSGNVRVGDTANYQTSLLAGNRIQFGNNVTGEAMHQILKNGDAVSVTNFANEEVNTKETFTVVSRTGSAGVSSRKFAVASDGTVSVGGNIDTLPGSPNITLNANGSGTYSASLQIGPNAQAGDNPLLTLGSGNRRGTMFIKGPSPDANASAIIVEVPGSSTAFQVTHDGTTKIGGTSSNPNITLSADGQGVFYVASAAQATSVARFLSNANGVRTGAVEVRANGAIFATNTTLQSITSERRLKENINPVDAVTAWETIKSVPYYSYNFIGGDPSNVVYGPMADEVPDEMRIATDRTDDVGVIHTYDNGMLQARLYVALQTALTRIEALEAEVQSLKDN
ncbi:putative tail fiber protein [Synechococcus phage S-N03]|uniref:Putative tail fiber protein n=1 Tax=Synechococcus phage S-N03 TaxID=2718943 RepID=A0A6G8R5I1_9CAUD|nr:putative tail fiber protein [Synechococcus phage S-N03]QIN96641.1 putative tail fiber protein [Synechococcus phage S-N03]